MFMTITNDERRKVAAKLREARENLEEIPVPNDLRERCFTYMYHIVKVIAKVIGRGEIFTSLADLIEPEPERTCHVVQTIRYDYEFGYAGTEYVTELSCGHKYVDSYGDAPDYCPWCGARVVEE